MEHAAGKRVLTYTLAGLFAVVTVLAVYLAACRAFGFLAVNLLAASPTPIIAYLFFVRWVMQSISADFQSRSTLMNLILTAGLLVAGAIALVLLVASLAQMDEQLHFLPTRDAPTKVISLSLRVADTKVSL